MTTFATPTAAAAQPNAAAQPAEPARARVAVMVAKYQVDVVVPTKFTIETFIDDLIGVLAEAIGSEVDFTPTGGQWSLAQPGNAAIPRWRSLGDYDIADGAVLMLVPVETTEQYSPIVEEITDALALINEREFAEFDPRTAGIVGVGALIVAASVVAAMLSWSWTRSGSIPWCTVPALLLGAACWGGALSARRRGAPQAVFIGLVLAAMPLLFAGGAMIVPPAYGHPGPFAAANLAAGAVVLAVASATVLRMTKVGIATLSALAVLGLILTLAALPSTYLNLSTGQVATGVVLGGLILLAVAPRIAVLVAHIRPPDLPDPGDEVSPATLEDIFDADSGPDPEPAPGTVTDIVTDGGQERAASAIETRARLAVTTLIGLIAAVSIAIPAATITADSAHPGRVWELIMSLCVAGILALRARSYPDRTQATALIAASVLTVTGAGFVQVIGYHNAIARLLVALLVAVALVCGALAALLLPGKRLSPVTRRTIDIIEYMLIIVVPIVAFMVMGIYGAVRRI